MFSDIGDQLRKAREAEGYSLDDVAQRTRIRRKFIEALEAGEFTELPTPVQVRGFLRNYARFLGLDSDDVLKRMDEIILDQNRNPIVALVRRFNPRRRGDADDDTPAPPPVPRRPRDPKVAMLASSTPAMPETTGSQPALRFRLRRLLRFDVILLALVVAAIIGGSIWGGMQVSASMLGNADDTPEIVGATATRTPTQTPTVSPTPFANITFTPTAPPPLESFDTVELQLFIEQRSLLIVSVDGEQVYRAVAMPGEQLSFSGQDVVEVTAANAAGVRAVLNQRDFGQLGGFGEVVIRLFVRDGFITPTPTADIPQPDPLGTPAPPAEPEA